jgi:RNA polymerase sigma factor (sigma-70 family)
LSQLLSEVQRAEGSDGDADADGFVGVPADPARRARPAAISPMFESVIKTRATLSTEVEDFRGLIRRALAREPAAVRDLVGRISPVIERRVASTLWQRKSRLDVRQEVKDMTQAVFLSLFEDDGKALRAWDPDRGSPFESFVALLAHRQVISILRNWRTSPWPDEPTEADRLDGAGDDGPAPDAVVESREHLFALLDRIRDELSPVGLELFQRLIVDEEPIGELSRRFKMSEAALYQWKSRLLKRLRALSAEILATPASEKPGPWRIVKEPSARDNERG